MQNIKRIIFDLDNTLISWKKEYCLAAKLALEEHKINLDYLKMDFLSSNYEKNFSKFTIEDMTNYFNNLFNMQVSQEFIVSWLRNLGNMSEENPKLTELLRYLSNKYELVILTNWFKKTQYERLKKAKIAGFFLEVIGGDEIMKPNPESFKHAMGLHIPEECLMIGDSYDVDIKVARELGLKTIWLNPIKTDYDGKTIKDIYELKRLL